MVVHIFHAISGILFWHELTQMLELVKHSQALLWRGTLLESL